MIEIQLDTRALDHAFRELASRVDDMTPAMRAIGESIAGNVVLLS